MREAFSTLELFIDSVPHFIAFVDAEERYQLVNRNYENWFECPRDQIIGRKLAELHRPATYAGMVEHIRKVMSGQATNFENHLTGRDGQKYCFDVRYVPRRSPAGAITGYFVLALDVTSRQEAEEALRYTTRRLELIAQMSTDVLGNHTVADAAQRLAQQVQDVFEVDACVIRVLGTDSLQLLGASGVPADQLLLHLPIFGLAKAVVKDRHPVVVADVGVDPLTSHLSNPAPGGFAFRSYAGVPLMVKDEVIGVLGIYMTRAPRNFTPEDIAHLQIVANHTAINLANERLFNTVQTQKDQLEAAMHEQRLLEEQFRQSQKMEALGQLSGGVAHDFNNLLAVISGNASLLELGSELPPDKREALDEIRLASERAAALTRQLLAFSRRQPLQPRNVDLNTVVENMGKMIRRILGAHISVRLKPLSQPAVIHADMPMMEQVLLNLVVNARDAMPRGGELAIAVTRVRLTAEAAAAMPPAQAGEFAVLSVSDTGCGITPEILPRIFEPFFTTKASGKGTGLGLATVFSIVHQHEGWVTVRSEVGQGTTFQIYLPCLPHVSPAEISPAASAAPAGGTETILLAEDEPALRRLIIQGLTRQGYRVLESASGVEACANYEVHQSEIHLLLTDMVMPGGVGGRELARRLRARDPKLKVVFMSGYVAELNDAAGELVEGVNFLPKPFDQPALAKIIRQALDAPPPA